MKVLSKSEIKNSTTELVIEVGAEEFEAALEKVYRKNRGTINVAGFRKGHAPRKIIEGMYGPRVFFEDAVDATYTVAYTQALDAEGLHPVAYPQIEVKEVTKEGYTFSAIVTLKPEAKIGTYKGLVAHMESTAVTEEDMEAELKPFVQRASRLVTVTRKAKLGDTVVLDFEGFDAGVAFDGGKAEGHTLELGSHSFIPGFEEAIVGMKAEEKKDIEVTFPEDYSPDLAGHAVIFKVLVHEVKETQAPTIDDEFAKDVSEFDSLLALKTDLGAKLTDRRKAAADRAFEDEVMGQLSEALTVELPDAMVDYRAEQVLEDYAERFKHQGIEFGQYLKMTGQSVDDIKLQAKAAATAQIRSELALDAIAVTEEMKISAEEIDAEYEKLAEQYEMTVEDVKNVAAVEDVTLTLTRRKAMQLVKDEAVITEGTKPEAKKPAAKKAAAKAEPASDEKPAKKAAAPKAEKPEAEAKPAAKKAAAPKADAEAKPAAKKPAK